MSEDIEHPWIFWPALILLMIGSVAVMVWSRSSAVDLNEQIYEHGRRDQDEGHMRALAIKFVYIADDPDNPSVMRRVDFSDPADVRRYERFHRRMR